MLHKILTIGETDFLGGGKITSQSLKRTRLSRTNKNLHPTTGTITDYTTNSNTTNSNSLNKQQENDLINPFMDCWANPLLVRGVPESQQQLLDSAISHKPLFIYNNQQQIPFYTRTGGNRNAVLPNDIFDVMADAEQSGGVILRNLGMLFVI